jgi:hypothetical protein
MKEILEITLGLDRNRFSFRSQKVASNCNRLINSKRFRISSEKFRVFAKI